MEVELPVANQSNAITIQAIGATPCLVVIRGLIARLTKGFIPAIVSRTLPINVAIMKPLIASKVVVK